MVHQRTARLIHDWNLERSAPAPPEGGLFLFDETLRDGLQSPAVRVPSLEEKATLLRLMDALGLEHADVGFPAAGERMAEDSEALIRLIAEEGLRVRPALAGRTLLADIRPIVEIAARTGAPVEAALFIGSSPIRMDTEGWTVDLLRRRTEEAVGFAVYEGLDVVFVTEDTTRSRPEHLEAVFVTAVRAGARRICVADTVGHALPWGAGALVGWAREILDRTAPEVAVDWHGHNDRGMAIANALAAVAAGADRVHATAFGLGERVGNVPMEQLLVNLELLGWWRGRLDHLADYCRLSASILGVRVPSWAPVVGRDAFTTGTGVHASSVLKALERGDRWLADRVYSAVPASMIGRRQTIVVGPLSGESNVTAWMLQRGLTPRPSLVRAVLSAAKNHHRPLRDDEIEAIIAEVEAGEGGTSAS